MSEPLNLWVSTLLTDHGPSLLEVLANCTADSLKHKAMHKSADAVFVTEVFAATAAVSRS